MIRPIQFLRHYMPILAFFGLAVAGSSCKQETYEPGDGKYSFLRSDFVEVATNASGAIVAFNTDDNRRLTLKTPMATRDLKADTIYRALVYYSEPTSGNLEVRNIRMINVSRPWTANDTQEMKTDPTGWESAWISKNRKYLNLALNLKVGVSYDKEADTRHIVSVRKDSVIDRHVFLTLYHDQNGVPEYYTHKSFLSISLGKDVQPGDAFTITVNTYKGLKKKTVYVP